MQRCGTRRGKLGGHSSRETCAAETLIKAELMELWHNEKIRGNGSRCCHGRKIAKEQTLHMKVTKFF